MEFFPTIPMIMKKNKSLIAIVLLCIAALIGMIGHGMGNFGDMSPKFAEAQNATGNVNGYAWSPNIGWISFNCTDTYSCDKSPYSVNIDVSNGAISGYAWSSNVGWISFNETTGCPSGSCGAYVDNVPAVMTGYKAVKGWARALVGGTAAANDWDGWIQLDHNQSEPLTYSFENQEFKGYAWGGPLVSGWISFNSSNTGTTPAYSVTGPGLVGTTLGPLGPITTISSCDASKQSYLSVSTFVLTNTAPNIIFTAYPVDINGVVGPALPAGSIYGSGGGARIMFRDYNASTSPLAGKQYAIYASVSSPPSSVSTATTSLKTLTSGFTCVTPDPNNGSAFVNKIFIIDPDIVTPPDQCIGNWNVTSNGNAGSTTPVCTLGLGNQAPVSVPPVGSQPVGFGANTLRCKLVNNDDDTVIYDSFTLTRKCFKNADIIEH
jgi:hypothetical protein